MARQARAPETAPRTQTAHRDFEAAFLEFWPRVYRLLYRLVGDAAEAEDLALETFWRLHVRAPAVLDGHPNPAGWLNRVATHLGLNALRARQRRARYEQDPQAAPAAGASPDESLQEAEERRRVRQVLAEMDARQAQLLMLRHTAHSYQEIAAAAGVKPGSVGTMLARAEREFERRYLAHWPASAESE